LVIARRDLVEAQQDEGLAEVLVLQLGDGLLDRLRRLSAVDDLERLHTDGVVLRLQRVIGERRANGGDAVVVEVEVPTPVRVGQRPMNPLVDPVPPQAQVPSDVAIEEPVPVLVEQGPDLGYRELPDQDSAKVVVLDDRLARELDGVVHGLLGLEQAHQGVVVDVPPGDLV